MSVSEGKPALKAQAAAIEKNRWHRVLESDNSLDIISMTGIVAVGLVLLAVAQYALHGSLPDLSVGSASAFALEDQKVSRPTIAFSCAEGKALIVAVAGAQASLTLSDGRQIMVPRVTEDRYANPDQSFVLEIQSSRASLTEKGSQTYRNCVAR